MSNPSQNDPIKRMCYGDEEDARVVTPVESFEEVDDSVETDRPIASVTQTLNDQDEDDNARRSG